MLAAPALSADPVAPFTAEYRVKVAGITLGRLERVLEAQDDGRFRFHSTTRPTALARLVRNAVVTETSTWVWHDTTAVAESYRYDRSGGDELRRVDIVFDHAARTIRNTVDGDPWVMALEPLAVDKLAYQVLLMADLASGLRVLHYRVADGGRMKDYHFVAGNEERVNTPAGDYQAIKLERHKAGDARRIELWCAPALGYLPIRVRYTEDDGSVTNVLLEDYRPNS